MQYLVLTLLANANDIEINPVPSRTDTFRLYQCGTCDVIVEWGEKCIICETCDQWYHAMC